MNLITYIKEAISNLSSAKLRSALAILGILVGTASVVAMVTSGQLATQAALKQFEQLGTGLYAISLSSANQGESGSSQPQINLTDALNMKNVSTNVISVAPYTSAYGAITYAGEDIQGSIIGATESLQQVIRIKLTAGRFISNLDGYSYYCVIGNTVAQKIQTLGISNPVGTQIQLGKNVYTIVGVAAKWPENAFFYQDINSAIIVPILSSSIISKYAVINNIILNLKPKTNPDVIQAKITKYVSQIDPNLRVFSRSAKQLLTSMEAQRKTFTMLLSTIGSISLLVGGIGVMNIMLVSVTERRKEIGIRKALGAKRKDIQMLFLMESITLTMFGGLMGVLVGTTVSFIIAEFAHWQFSIFLIPSFVGFAVSVAIGIFFGFYPAYQAARLDPIETLRSD